MFEIKPFGRLAQLDAPSNLKGAVFARVAQEEKKAFIRNFIISITVEALSIFVVFISISHIVGSFISSGTYNYISLLFTDGFSVISYSRELLLSIAESVPIFAVVGAFTAILFFGWSTIRIIKNRSSIFVYHAI